jgi:hypothetical protein
MGLKAKRGVARRLPVPVWSMKSDRELIQLTKSETLEAIANHLQRSPAYVLKRAVRLGLTIKGRKVKGK